MGRSQRLHRGGHKHDFDGLSRLALVVGLQGEEEEEEEEGRVGHWVSLYLSLAAG